MMKSILRSLRSLSCGLVLTFAATSAYAAESIAQSANPDTSAKILAGDANLDFSAYYAHTSYRNSSGNSWSASTSTKFFVADRFAVGPLFSWDKYQNEPGTALLGLGADYYFPVTGNLIPFLGASYRFGLTDSSVDGVFEGDLGLRYFFTSTIAVGPRAFYRKYTGDFSDIHSFGADLTLAIYF